MTRKTAVFHCEGSRIPSKISLFESKYRKEKGSIMEKECRLRGDLTARGSIGPMQGKHWLCCRALRCKSAHLSNAETAYSLNSRAEVRSKDLLYSIGFLLQLFLVVVVVVPWESLTSLALGGKDIV